MLRLAGDPRVVSGATPAAPAAGAAPPTAFPLSRPAARHWHRPHRRHPHAAGPAHAPHAPLTVNLGACAAAVDSCAGVMRMSPRLSSNPCTRLLARVVLAAPEPASCAACASCASTVCGWRFGTPRGKAGPLGTHWVPTGYRPGTDWLSTPRRLALQVCHEELATVAAGVGPGGNLAHRDHRPVRQPTGADAVHGRQVLEARG